MQPTPQVSLSNYSTMRLGGIADWLLEISDIGQIGPAYAWAAERALPVIVIGGGSNIIWRDEGFQGLVLVNKLKYYEDLAEDGTSHYVTIGAGENWDSAVARTAADGLTGIEALSLIPGTAGATPVQNVGAYGQDISQTLVSVEAYDTHTGQLTVIPNEACGFGYRSSTFQTEYRGRFFITAITLHLQAADPLPPYYGAVQDYLEQHLTEGQVTPSVLRDAVSAIRRAKLPDPAETANNGSFFGNPVISNEQLLELRAEFPGLPAWQTEDGQAKIPAAWLIEQAGYKDFHDEVTGMATWPTQPLVLVNEHARTTADLLAFRDRLTDLVKQKFGITLTQEPELLP